MTPVLVTLQQAKDQVQAIGFDDDDSQILRQAADATDVVMDYLKDRANKNGWTDRTVPGRVRTAILMVLTNLYASRGDGPDADPLSDAVMKLLERDRDPTLA